jgi:hypothetical protein
VYSSGAASSAVYSGATCTAQVGTSLAAAASCTANPAGGYYTLASPSLIAQSSYADDGSCTKNFSPLTLAPGVCLGVPGVGSLKLTSSGDGLTVYSSTYLNANCAGVPALLQYGATNACLAGGATYRATAGLPQPAFVAPTPQANNIAKQ